MDFAALVKKRIEELGLNVNQAEKRFGFSQGYIRGVIRRDSKAVTPGLDKVEAISKALGLEVYVGPPRIGQLQGQAIDQIIPPDIDARLDWASKEDAKRFPNYPDDIEWVTVRPFDIDTSGEKPERVPIYDTKALISLPKEWFEDRNIDPDNAGILRCKDVHMLSVPYDALVLVDFGDTSLAFNSIHALVQGGELRVRWLAPVRDAGALVAVVLTAERPAHSSETLQGAELAGIVILGRVRAVISTLD